MLIYTGRTVQPDEALRLGIVDEVIDASLARAPKRWPTTSPSLPAQAFPLAKRQLRDRTITHAKHYAHELDADVQELWGDPATHRAHPRLSREDGEEIDCTPMSFHALVAHEDRVAFEELTDDDLPKDGVTVDVAYSSLNYKDGLAVTRRGRIVRHFPMVLGIDLAGTVVDSDDPEFTAGRPRRRHTARVSARTIGAATRSASACRADAIVHVPDGISLEQAMQIGTAGITAMLCVLALEQNGVLPDDREIVVTGAAGGVGSLAVMLLAAPRLSRRRIHRPSRARSRTSARLGATSIVPREELAQKGAPMQTERWAGGIDTVGGVTLANVFAQTAYGGAVACCGMAGGHELHVTVWPLILRNVSLLGVSSLRTPKPQRIEAWARLDARPRLPTSSPSSRAPNRSRASSSWPRRSWPGTCAAGS